MHRLLKAATIPMLAGAIVVGASIAAEPPKAVPPAPVQIQPGPSQGLYRHDGNNTTLIPLATDTKVSYPFLIGPPPGVTFAAQSVADKDSSKAPAGDDVVLEMTGDLAREYCRLSGLTAAGKDSIVQVSATILARTRDGRIVVEHEGTLGSKGTVLVYGIVDEDKVSVTTTPAGTRVYSSPKSKDSTLTTTESKTRMLKLSSTEGLTLRTLDAKK